MKLKFLTAITWVGLAMASQLSVPAQGVLTFEDLPTSGEIPPGYHGFQWPGFWYVDAPQFTRIWNQNLYENALVSGTQVAFNYGGGSPSLSRTTPFTLSSGYFTASGQPTLQLQVRGFISGALAYDNTYELNSLRPTYLPFAYKGVDEVNFLPVGGSFQWFAMDNLQIDPVPEPGTPSLLALGIGLAALKFRCRVRRKIGWSP